MHVAINSETNKHAVMKARKSVHFGCQKVTGHACMPEDDIDMCDTADYFIRCPPMALSV